MIRTYLVVEGQSEERFARAVLAPHLALHGVALYVMSIPLGGGGRGGGRRWERWHRFLSRLLKEQRGGEVRVTTWLDLYAIPTDAPGWDAPVSGRGSDRADRIVDAIRLSLPDPRFIPYVQVHEFEALHFSRLDELRPLAESHGATAAFEQLRESVAGLEPEDIDDGPTTAPSKRIAKAIPQFRKTVDGVEHLGRIGLPLIRSRCPRFDVWLTVLESTKEKQP